MGENSISLRTRMSYCRSFPKEFYKRFRKTRMSMSSWRSLVQRYIVYRQRIANSRSNTDEVCLAVKQIGPLKAPHPDGMHAIFYQKYWNVISKTVYSMIRAFLHHGHLLKELNITHTNLIPEKKNPARVNDFRPISLYNVSCKFYLKASG